MDNHHDYKEEGPDDFDSSSYVPFQMNPFIANNPEPGTSTSTRNLTPSTATSTSTPSTNMGSTPKKTAKKTVRKPKIPLSAAEKAHNLKALTHALQTPLNKWALSRRLDPQINLSSPQPTQPDAPPLTTFHGFPKLLIEIRLMIWSLSAPPPTTIIQRPSRIPGRTYTYHRPVPAVLHACRESRNEFIDHRPGVEDASLERRKKAHPVYRLAFKPRNSRTRGNPVWFCDEIDTFWALADNEGRGGGNGGGGGNIEEGGGHWQWDNLSRLDIVPTIRFLVLSRFYFCACKLDRFSRRFPNLEEITMLIPNKRKNGTKLSEIPEKNGEIDFETLGLGDATADVELMREVGFYAEDWQHSVTTVKTWHRDPKLPKVKFRFVDQFLENEKIEVPKEGEKDPLEELEGGLDASLRL